MKTKLNKYINKDYIEVGAWVYITEDTAGTLNIIYDHISDGIFKAEGGFYFITVINKDEFDKSLPEHAQPYCTIWLQHENWKNQNIEDIPITLNSDGNIILPGELIISEALFQVSKDIQTLKQLTEINRNRHFCVLCDQPLHILSDYVRVCGSCESALT